MTRLAVAVLVATAGGACAPTLRPTPDPALPPASLDALWTAPTDLAQRDLYYGPGGREGEPPLQRPFTVKAFDSSGYSRGFDLVDAEGRDWDVKVGPEAQTEVVASRLLWAVGYHQPPTYYVTEWRAPGVSTAPARFRPDVESDGEWAWAANPFVGTAPYRGLVVANLLLNNWDFKTSNNRIYVGRDGRRYVVQDLGASLGRTKFFPHGTRNDPEGFDDQGFVTDVEADGTVRFDYHGRHRELIRDIRVDDVLWTCRLFAQLSDRQWDDAFRAAAYDAGVRQRYIAKIKQKVASALALAGRQG